MKKMPATSIFVPERWLGSFSVTQAVMNAAIPTGMLIQKHQRQSSVVREQTAEQRADDGGDAEERAHRAHVLSAVLRGHDVRDDRLRQDHQTTAAEALHEPERDELGEGLRRSRRRPKRA